MNEADIINNERYRMASSMIEKLKAMGIGINVSRYTGDNSFPVEYTITYKNTTGMGPTFDMTLINWIETLIRQLDQEPALSYDNMSTALKHLTGSIRNLRREMFLVKGLLTNKEEEAYKEEEA